jgi:hypothetical protein
VAGPTEWQLASQTAAALTSTPRAAHEPIVICMFG